jgi:hypothetical protein
MGSFRPAAGNQHLHWYCNFAGPPIETVPKSLLHSCRSELTRQGISLSFLRRFHDGLDSIFIQQPASAIPARQSRASLRSMAGVWRIVSEDPRRPPGFLRIVQSRTIVTDRRRNADRVGRALRMFPHIARLSPRVSAWRGNDSVSP